MALESQETCLCRRTSHPQCVTLATVYTVQIVKEDWQHCLVEFQVSNLLFFKSRDFNG